MFTYLFFSVESGFILENNLRRSKTKNKENPSLLKSWTNFPPPVLATKFGLRGGGSWFVFYGKQLFSTLKHFLKHVTKVLNM